MNIVKEHSNFALTDMDKCSDFWLRLKAYLESENNKDRLRNDNQSLTEDETRLIRARIAVRKSLLNLDL